MRKENGYKLNNYGTSLYIIIFILVVILAILDITYRKSHIKEHLVSLEDNIYKEYKFRLKESVDQTIIFLDTLYGIFIQRQKEEGLNSNILNGKNYELFENEVRKNLYYNLFEKEKYIWINKINNYSGGENYAIRLINPKFKDKEGENISSNIKDMKGNMPFLYELNALKKNSEVFFNKEFDLSDKKTSYSRLYKKLDWLISTEISSSVIENKIKKNKEILVGISNEKLLNEFLIKLAIILSLFGLIYFFRVKIKSYLLKTMEGSSRVLDESKKKLFKTTVNTNLGVWKWDIVENTLDWDEEMYKIYEIDPSEKMNSYLQWANRLVKKDLIKVEKNLKKSIKNKKRVHEIFRIKSSKGLKYIESFGKTIYDENDKPLYMIGVNIDVTSTQKQQSIIRRQSKSLSKYVIYSRTNKNGIITDVSEPFCNISGYSRDELIGKSHSVIRHSDVTEEFFIKLWDTLKKRELYRGEIKNKRKDGSYYWVYIDISPEYDSLGNFLGYISIQRDITAKKDLEQQQVQIIEQAKMASLGEMIANIAHQWRQPLSVISASSTGMIIQKEFGILSDDFLLKELENINTSVQHLSETINIFRDFVKDDKTYKEVILQETIDDTLNILSSTLKNNHIELINNLNSFEPIKIELIEGEFSQVILNIINNAKDAIKEKKIENPMILIDLEKQGSKIIMKIEDNAGGIQEDILPHIFEPYFTTKHKSQGTGLGLYMSKKIICESLKGNLYVKNNHQGVIFFIELPLNEILEKESA